MIGGYLVRDPRAAVVRRAVPVRPLQYRDHLELGAQAGATATDTGLNVPSVSGFGEDGAGHLYATSLAGGVYRLGQNAGGTLTKTSIGTSTSPSPWPRPPATRTSCSSSRSQDVFSCTRPRGRRSSST